MSILEDVDGLLVRESLQGLTIDGEDLVTATQRALVSGSSFVEYSLDVDGEVTVGRSVAADY